MSPASTFSTRQELIISVVLTIVLTIILAILDFVMPVSYQWPIAFVVPLALTGWTRQCWWIWLSAICMIGLTLAGACLGPKAAPEIGYQPFWYNRVLIMVSIAATAVVVDLWVRFRRRSEAAHLVAEQRNRELEQREEEIARQNEELQSQSEELERQSEELRISNEELSQRQRMLETLLDLSRALTLELTQGQIMHRICETLWHLIDGPDTATAILIRENDSLSAKCQYGFGHEVARSDPIPYADSFASLVISQNRSAYIEDLSLRPDLHVPNLGGEPMQAILAAPLMVRGKAIGTLEIYGRAKRRWSDEQVSLAESLAAQAAISLENGLLFEEIERERARLASVLRSVPLGMLICDEDCRSIRANPAGAALLNIPSDTPLTVQETFAHIVAIDHGRPLAPEEHPVVLAARQGLETHGREMEWILPGGRRVYILSSAVPVRERDGKVIGALSAKTDITQLKMLQRELDLRRREAEEANVRKTRFLAAASHDIRTPANAISLLAELIKRTADTPKGVAEVKDLAGELHASSLSLVELVTNVLDVTRFDTDKLELRESDFPLGALLEEEVRQAMPLAEEKGLTVQCPPIDPPIWLRADRIKLGRIMGNLLSNAIKFTERGSITIATRTDNAGTLEISVADTGIGISFEHLSRVFDEFYQITEARRFGGSGLGLAICKRLVEAMGGEISARSKPGEGSTFTVRLPARTVIPRHRISTAVSQ